MVDCKLGNSRIHAAREAGAVSPVTFFMLSIVSGLPIFVKPPYGAPVEEKEGRKLIIDWLDQLYGIFEDRVRILELLDISGVKISNSLKTAVSTGADSGTFAKERVRELNEALTAPTRGTWAARNRSSI